MTSSANIPVSACASTVLVVAHAWHDDMYGGAFRMATEFALGLAANGVHVTYLCCNVMDSPDREVIRGVEVRRYRIPSSTSAVPRFWQHVRGAQALARDVAAEFEVVAVSGHSPLQYYAALRALNYAAQLRSTYVVHSPFADEQLALSGSGRVSWKLRVRAMVGAFIDRWCLRSSKNVQCLSRFTADSLKRRYGTWLQERCIECPGWVDTKRFYPAIDRRLCRTQLPKEWHTDDPILLTVRRLERRMGLDTLIEAAAMVAKQRPFRLLIGGSGPEAENLRNAIQQNGLEDRVFLLGRIPEELLPACYAASDLFVLPTRSLECFGLIVLEAFASETPVIGARVGAIPEILSQIGEDWMFTPGDALQLSERLRTFLDGQMPTAGNLRDIATRYDVRQLLPLWIESCIGSQARLNFPPTEVN